MRHGTSAWPASARRWVCAMGVAVLGSCYPGAVAAPGAGSEANPTSAGQTANLIQNGSAEESKDGKPIGWRLYVGAAGDYSVVWGTAPDGSDGTACAFLLYYQRL